MIKIRDQHFGCYIFTSGQRSLTQFLSESMKRFVQLQKVVQDTKSEFSRKTLCKQTKKKSNNTIPEKAK